MEQGKLLFHYSLSASEFSYSWRKVVEKSLGMAQQAQLPQQSRTVRKLVCFKWGLVCCEQWCSCMPGTTVTPEGTRACFSALGVLNIGLTSPQEPCVMPLEQPWCRDAAGLDQALVPPPRAAAPCFRQQALCGRRAGGLFCTEAS